VLITQLNTPLQKPSLILAWPQWALPW
jgi:hypothetical protein